MTGEPAPIVPIEQRAVDFYGDIVYAALLDIAGEEHIYVPLRPICEGLGLDWRSQRHRIRRDDILSDVVQGVVIMTPLRQMGGEVALKRCWPSLSSFSTGGSSESRPTRPSPSCERRSGL